MHWIEPESSVWKSPAPDFNLPAQDGQTITRAQFRQKSHLVLVFLPDPETASARHLVDALAAKRDEFTLANAVVFAISPHAAAEATPLPALIDDGSAIRNQYAALLPIEKQPAANTPFVMILNRYGRPEFAGFDLFEDGAIEQIAAYVWSLEYQCSL